MAKLESIGRPYALAAFQHARKQTQVPEWKAFLEAAANVSQDATVAKLLADPKFAATQLFELFEGVLSSLLNSEQKNFLLLLAQNKRLMVLPEISALFNNLCTQLDKLTDVKVVTAVAVNDNVKDKLAQALTKRIQREVTLHCEVDPAVLGGAVIHFGDRVIDGSVRGKLTRLLEYSLR